MEQVDEKWSIFAFWTSALILKLLLFTWFTGRYRVFYKVIHSKEDEMWIKGSDFTICPRGHGHPEIERICDTHLNNLEAILTYLIIVPLWAYTDPPILLFRIILYTFITSRCLYTMFYMNIFRVPLLYEHLCLCVNYGVVCYTAVKSFTHFVEF